MYESDMRDNKKITVFPGNIFRVKCHMLVLYEVRSYSHAYKRISSKLDMSNSDKNEKYGETQLLFFKTRRQKFSSICVIDSTKPSSSVNFKIMEEISKFLTPLLNNLTQSTQKIVAFNLTDQQETESLKYLIDKFLSLSQSFHAILAGTPLNTNHMLSHLNQSGHLLTNSAIETPTLIKSYFEHLMCQECKRIDINSKSTSDFSKLYCKTCAPLFSAYTNCKYVKKCISLLKEKCYCKADYRLGERDSHLASCTTTVFCCEKCEFYSGQHDFARHYVMAHSKEVYDRMDDMWKKRIDKNIKVQCHKCGNFYQQEGGRCTVCLEKEIRAKMMNK